jgi:hypothetical protein
LQLELPAFEHVQALQLQAVQPLLVTLFAVLKWVQLGLSLAGQAKQ